MLINLKDNYKLNGNIQKKIDKFFFPEGWAFKMNDWAVLRQNNLWINQMTIIESHSIWDYKTNWMFVHRELRKDKNTQNTKWKSNNYHLLTSAVYAYETWEQFIGRWIKKTKAILVSLKLLLFHKLFEFHSCHFLIFITTKKITFFS